MTECHAIVVKAKPMDPISVHLTATSEDMTISMTVAAAVHDEESKEMVARALARAMEWKWKEVRKAGLPSKYEETVYLLPKG